MAFTWTGDPSASTIEQIRWEIRDIDSTNPKFQDAEITYAYDQEHSVLGAAARLCEQLQVRYADAGSRTMGPLKVDMTNLSRLFKEKAADLRRRCLLNIRPYAGGYSDAKEEVFEDDSDLIQPTFEKGMMDNT
jgi:hypothetical protein